MQRKEWLETFLKLVHGGAATIEYRKRLRLKTPDVAKHIKRIGDYQRELDLLTAADEYEEAERQAELRRQENLEEERKEAARSRKYAIQRQEMEAIRDSILCPLPERLEKLRDLGGKR